MGRPAVVVALLLVVGCSSSPAVRSEPSVSTLPPVSAAPAAAGDAVTAWLVHLAARDDAAAFADLAPRSQASVGDVGNYERGSGRFGGVYSRYAGVRPVLLQVAPDLVVATLTKINASTAVPVRRVASGWRVDPILDAGAYSIDPPDGGTIAATGAVRVQLDDPAARARVWFDGRDSGPGFRPAHPLSPGTHVATVVIQRGDDIVARALTLTVG